jgi:NADH-quinone oxidoreductase subunit G
MTKVLVNDVEIEVPADFTVMQACEAAGIEIPRFCYHERLSVAGNCRMCLVEVKGFPKPQASCALGVKDLRGGPNGEPPAVITNSPVVKKARQGVMEFLLLNHPLDCPVCDQGGECDLQDQAVAYGYDKSRSTVDKRAKEEINFGPLIKTEMTRCIQCTRCVRFATEVAGVPELGAIGRGEDTEITPYIQSIVTSELSGNVIDLCPVGALTSKPYAFVTRPWELTKTESIDVMDALGSSIRVDSRANQVLRIMPVRNDAINEEWLSDRSRFIVDGLSRQRLDTPYVRGADGKLKATDWNEALQAVASKIASTSSSRIAALAGDLVDAETLFAYKDLFSKLGVQLYDCRQRGEAFAGIGDPAVWRFNQGIASIDEADCIVLVGSNPRLEASVLNARIRKRWLASGLPIATVGDVGDLTYPVVSLGNNPNILSSLAEGTHSFVTELAKSQKPLFIIGETAFTHTDAGEILANITTILGKMPVTEGWNGYAVLHTNTGLITGLEAGFVSESAAQNSVLNQIEQGSIDLLFLIGADEATFIKRSNLTVIYQGTHGDKGAHQADIILAGATYVEKSATYVNTEGRAQQTRRAVFPVGDAKEDWAIARALQGVCGVKTSYNTLSELRQALFSSIPVFSFIGLKPAPSAVPLIAHLNKDAVLSGQPFVYRNHDLESHYYFSNPICRASRVMAECSQKKGMKG